MEDILTTLVMENKNLIHSMTHYFEGYGSKADLFQVGVIGLIKAYQNYNENMGVKFSTYAYPYILGEMKKCVREDKGIKFNREVSKLNLQIEKSRILLSQRLMREPSISELASFLELSEFEISEAIKAINCISSIDLKLEDGLSLHEVVPCKEGADLNSLIDLRNALTELNPLEKELIQKRYYNDLTQSETAKKLNMSQVQVSRNEQKVLTKLKSKLAA